jgi:hypothetical protein
MKALSANNYAAATAPFDPAMKASFSPERIGSIWRHATEANGRLISWGVSQRSTGDCRETIVAPLKFDHKSNLAAFISVNPNGEVSGLYFAPTPVSPISATPATSSPPAVVRNFDSIDVNVGSLEQCSTITIPTTASGPWPGVVLMGSADKDGTAGAKHFFKDIAEGLSARGIVVLRYDKRWYDIFDKRDRQDLTVEKDYLDDGAAAVNLLRARGEVAKDRIFVAGYDLAGAITPDVARGVAPVQGLILLAPAFPGRKVGASELRNWHYLGWESQPQFRRLECKAKELIATRCRRRRISGCIRPIIGTLLLGAMK